MNDTCNIPADAIRIKAPTTSALSPSMRPVLAFLAGTLAFGGIGVTRVLSGMDAGASTCARALWGLLALVALSALFRPRVLLTSISDAVRGIIIGSVMGAAIVCYFETMDAANQGVGALFLFASLIWFPLYTALALPQEAKQKRWPAVWLAIALAVGGVVLVVWPSGDSVVRHPVATVGWGTATTFLGFLTWTVGRWLYPANNPQERLLASRLAARLGKLDSFNRILSADMSRHESQGGFWTAVQKMIWRCVGIATVSVVYLVSGGGSIVSAGTTGGMIGGAVLGIGCLAFAFSAITWADENDHRDHHGNMVRLSTTLKGMGTVLELVLAVILGFVVLNQGLGTLGWIGLGLALAGFLIEFKYGTRKSAA